MYEAKKYEASIEVYEQLLKQNPNYRYYHSKKGLAYFHLGVYQKAQESFRLATLYANPDNKETLATDYTNLAATYSALDKNEKAYEYSLKAYHLD